MAAARTACGTAASALLVAALLALCAGSADARRALTTAPGAHNPDVIRGGYAVSRCFNVCYWYHVCAPPFRCRAECMQLLSVLK